MTIHRPVFALLLASAAAGCLDTASLDNDRGRSGLVRAGVSQGSSNPTTAPARPNASAGAGPRGGAGAISNGTASGTAGKGGSSNPSAPGNVPAKPGDDPNTTGMAGAPSPAPPGAGGSMPGSVAGSALAAGCSSYQLPANGMCGGYYCGVTEETLARESNPAAKCLGTAAFKCEGRIVLVVGTCARRFKSSMPFATNAELRPMIRDCVFEDAEIAQMVQADCLSCFIDAAQCAGDNCLIECLSGDSASCDSCRIQNNCEQPVFPCSGLPNPF
jgi:hypothetical protein